MLALRCKAQNYEWGREASCSEVAQLAKANGSSIDESKPFAELWMGTHPNCPSVVAATGENLKHWLERHPECLGATTCQQFGVDLPFLFKVLSVRKALSIQSHPDKQLAQRLHAKLPKLYPDDNHKPEMALALSEFEALCGFCPQAELQHALRTVPELASCVGEPEVSALLSTSESNPGFLKAAFTALMTCEPTAVTAAIATMVDRLQLKQQQAESGSGEALSPKESLALRLNQQYPGGDVGVLSCFFLNLVHMSPGQAIYLPANVPHAYLSGELMECMAASDNVIRAGLTPKFKDTEVLCASLTYEQGAPQVLQGEDRGLAPGVRVYQPPFEEFEMHSVAVAAGETLQLPRSSGPRLVLVQHGAGSAAAKAAAGVVAPELEEQVHVARGSILFVPAGSDVAVSSEGDGPLVMWASAVNSTFLQLSQALQDAAVAAVAGEVGLASPKVVGMPVGGIAAIFCAPAF